MKRTTQYAFRRETIIKNRRTSTKLNSSYIVLEVSKETTKYELKEALQLMLGSIQISINTLNVPEHKRRVKSVHQTQLRKKIMKKAYIRLFNNLPRT